MINNLSFTGTSTSGAQIAATPVYGAASQSLPNDTAMNGDLLAKNIGQPATPAAGATRLYVDTVGKIFSAVNDAGIVSRTVVPATAPAGQFVTGIAANGTIVFAAPAALPRNFIDGFVVSNDGTSPNTVLDVGPGQASDSTNLIAINSAGTFNKSTAGSWAVGSGANGMGTGLTISPSTWYFAHAIINGGAFDVYFDTSSTAANAPAGTTAYRCIYPFKTDGSSHIIPVTQVADDFLWTTGIKDINNAATPTGSPSLVALSVPPLVVRAYFQGTLNTSGSTGLTFAPPAMSMTGLTGANGIGSLWTYNTYAAAEFSIITNSSGQIAVQGNGSSNYTIITRGWTWRRGKQ